MFRVSRFRPQFVFGVFIWFFVAQFQARVWATDFLPDAATNLGTIVINSDDRFTYIPLVALTIHANGGLGITQMQFSTDDQNWSTPESYATSKILQIPVAVQDYPLNMNSVLKTVFVRFKLGDGTWTKAVSDSIVFVKSALDVPQIKEVWIVQQKPTGADYDGAQELGSLKNPYVVGGMHNQVAFDTLMNTLNKAYAAYRAAPNQWQAAAPPMNGTTVLDLHIGPGIYETRGDNGGRGGPYAWSPGNGWRIRGAGRGNPLVWDSLSPQSGWHLQAGIFGGTLLKLVGSTTTKVGDTNYYATVLGNMGGSGEAVYENMEISDLAVNANMHEGGDISSSWDRIGINFGGNNVQLRRLRVMGFGSRIPGNEPAGIAGHNSGVANNYNFLIEDCEVIGPQKKNAYTPLMIGMEGGGKDPQGNPYSMHNTIIRNNYVNGLMYDQNTPIDPYTNSFYERGSHGVGLGAAKDAIIEDNLVEHVLSGYYNDSFDIESILVRNNHYRDVIAGINFNTGASESISFEGNLAELDPHYYTTPVTGQTQPSDYGWREGMILNEQPQIPIKRAVVSNNIFQFTNRRSPDAPLTGAFGGASLSGSALIENNLTFGFDNTPITWYQWQGIPITYLDQQADILDASKPIPLEAKNNHRDNGTIVEVYPYVLDKTLPLPVVTPYQKITFPAPLINGALPTVVMGLPTTNVIDQSGNVNWTPTANDIGRYVVSFYDSLGRTKDPRRMLITVVSGLAESDPLFFSSGLMGYWKFDEASGAFADSSGNGHTIPPDKYLSAELALGVEGHLPGQKALHFNNSNPDKTFSVQISNSNNGLWSGFPLAYQPYLGTSTNLARPITISYWFMADHNPTGLEAIFNFGSLMTCGVHSNPDTSGTLTSTFCYFGYSPDMMRYQSLHPVPNNVATHVWHQQVLVYDGVSARMYLDGKKTEEVPVGQISTNNPADWPNEWIYLGGGWGGDNFLGSLSDLAVWNRPLSTAEVTQLYLAQQNNTNFPNVVRPFSPRNLRVLPF